MSSVIITTPPSSGSGDVTAAAGFGTDNRLLRSDGTGKALQASAWTIDDNGQASVTVDGNGEVGMSVIATGTFGVGIYVQADGTPGTAITADATNASCVAVVGYGSAPGAVGIKAVYTSADAIPFQIQNDFGYTASFSFPGTANRALIFPDKAGTVALTSDIKFYDELRLPFPHQVDGTGAVIDPVSTSPTYGHAIFSASAGKAGNFALYRFRVPYDLATSVELVASLAFRLSGADTGKHAYKLSMADLSASGAGDSPTFSNEIPLHFTGDGSGAAGDLEFVPAVGTYISLTGWAASLTPGHLAVVKLARDGSDGTNDTSTQSSSDVELVIMYARQPTLAS